MGMVLHLKNLATKWAIVALAPSMCICSHKGKGARTDSCVGGWSASFVRTLVASLGATMNYDSSVNSLHHA